MAQLIHQTQGYFQNIMENASFPDLSTIQASFQDLSAPKSLYYSILEKPYIALALSALLVVLIGTKLLTREKLPPGSKPLPMHSGLPPEAGIEAAWYFGDLHKKYGPIYAWKIFGITHIWIESDEVSKDLFVKRQRKYCDRNPLPASVGVREGKEVLPLMG